MNTIHGKRCAFYDGKNAILEFSTYADFFGFWTRIKNKNESFSKVDSKEYIFTKSYEFEAVPRERKILVTILRRRKKAIKKING